MKKLLKKNASYTVSISIVQNPFKLIKNKMLHFTLLIGVFAFASCTNDDPQPEPPAPNGELYTLKYKSQEILELKQMKAGQEVQNLPVEESNKYFGKRLSLTSPTELQLKDDSIFIIKNYGITEKYKMKSHNNEVFLYNDLSDVWEYCGTREDKNSFTLNIGFYIQDRVNIQRILHTAGQEYSLKSFSDLMEYVGKDGLSSVIWLKQQIVFE